MSSSRALSVAFVGLISMWAFQTTIRAAGEYSEQVVNLMEQLFAELKAHNIPIDQARITTELESPAPKQVCPRLTPRRVRSR